MTKRLRLARPATSRATSDAAARLRATRHATARDSATLHILIFDRTNIAKYAFDRIINVFVPYLYYDNQYKFRLSIILVATALVPKAIHPVSGAFYEWNVNAINMAASCLAVNFAYHKRCGGAASRDCYGNATHLGFWSNEYYEMHVYVPHLYYYDNQI